MGALIPLADITVTSSATLIHDDTPGRFSLQCHNNDGAVHVRWGNFSVTATKGQRLAAGTSVEIQATGPIYMISEGANVIISCTVQL